MRYPLAVDLLCDAQRAGIQQGNHLVYRFTGHGIHIRRGDLGATLKSGLNNVL